MKNFNRLYISLILLSSLTLAADKSYAFLGIQTSVASIQNKAVPTIGVKYGVQTRKYRTAISYNYAQNSQNRYQTVIMQMDTGIFSNLFREYLVKPYAGLSFGMMEETNRISSLSDRGYLYGANLGLAYIYNDALDFDVGYRYLQTSKLKELESLSDLTLSMHYFY